MSRDKWGKCLGYVSEPCPNCNRIRLEKYENGKHRCEKCEWSPEENNYVDWREIYPIEEEDFWNEQR